MYVRINDTVEVLTGDNKGKRGQVIRIDRAEGKVVVQGVNLVYRHVKPNKRNQQGGRLSQEMPISISNVALIDPVKGEPTRVGIRYLPDGSKELYAKKSGTTIRVLSKANPKYAQAK